MVWIKLNCPRCKATSSIDAALAGQYTICPACQARVLVPINAPAASAPGAPAPAVSPPPQTGNQPAPASGTPNPNLRKTVQAASLQTWVSEQPVPAAPGFGNGPQSGVAQPVRPVVQPPPPGAGANGGSATIPRQPQQPQGAAPVGRANPGSAAPAIAANSGVPLSPPMADVPLLPPRANSTQPTPPPAAPPTYAVQPVRPGYGGGPPLVGAGAMVPAPAVGAVPAAPPMPVPVGVALPAAGAIPPAGSRKVARFIAAEPSQSTIQLAADGQLPSLQLIEAGKTVVETSKGSSMNPLLVLGAIAASFCACVMLLTADFDSTGGEQTLNVARQQLEAYYKGQRGPLLPYQIHLREAQQAYSRGALKTARDHYRKVLDQLHAEGGDKFHGLTGTPASDQQLEKLLSELLGQDTSSGLLSDEP